MAIGIEDWFGRLLERSDWGCCGLEEAAPAPPTALWCTFLRITCTWCPRAGATPAALDPGSSCAGRAMSIWSASTATTAGLADATYRVRLDILITDRKENEYT